MNPSDQKDNICLSGEHVCLRSIQESDASEDYCRWMNDSEVNQYLESRFQPWSIEQIKEFVRIMRADANSVFFAIVDKDSDKHIGNLKIGPLRREHKTAEIGLVIGDKNYWGRGVGTEAVELACDFIFNSLNYRKATAGAYSVNESSVKVFQKCGFVIEGVRKKQSLCNGQYVDSVILGKLKECTDQSV